MTYLSRAKRAKGVATKTDQGSADQSMTSYIILVHIFVLILIQVSEQSAITTPQQKWNKNGR